MVNTWLHVLGLIVFIGAVAGLWIVLLPALSAAESPEERGRLLARALRFYNPLQVGALGVVSRVDSMSIPSQLPSVPMTPVKWPAVESTLAIR